MAKLSIKPGSTGEILYIFIQDSSVTTGAGLTGLVYNSSGLTAYYVRPGGSATAITLATQTVTGSFSSGGFVEVDSTNMPGLYRFDIPDAVNATGVRSGIVMLQGATNMAPVILEIDLHSEVDTTHLSATAQTARDIGASVLLSSGTGTGQISLASGAVTAGTVSDKTGYSISGTKTTLDALNDISIAGLLNTAVASYITAGTVGEAIALGSAALVDSTVTGTPTSTVFTFTGGNTNNGFYNDQLVYILSGTGVGQVRPILSSTYSAGTTTITVDEPWITLLVAGDRFAVIVSHIHPISQLQNQILSDATPFAGADIASILADTSVSPTAAQWAYIIANAATGLPITFSGTGTTTTGTLALVDGATPSSTTDQYKGRLLVFNAGTLNQCVTDITAYDGTTKIVTVTAVPVAITSSHTARLI